MYTLVCIQSTIIIPYGEDDVLLAKHGITVDQHEAYQPTMDELHERLGLGRKAAPEQTSAIVQHEPTYQDWLYESPDNVTTPVHSNGTTTPFHEAVVTGNTDMGSMVIDAARHHGISSDTLLKPVLDHYDTLSLSDPTSADQLASNVEAMGNKTLTRKLQDHIAKRQAEQKKAQEQQRAQQGLIDAVRSIHRDTWNLQTPDLDKPGMTEQNRQDAVTRFVRQQRSTLPIEKIERVVRRAIIHDVPVDTLLEPFQAKPPRRIIERHDPEMMKQLQDIHRRKVQRMVIKEVYDQIQRDFESAQVIRDTSQQTHDGRGKIRLKQSK